MKRNAKMLFMAAAMVAATGVATAQKGDLIYFYAHEGVIETAAEARSIDRSNATTEVISSGKRTGITWNITYLDAPGAGFNDNTLGAARKATLDAVLTYVDNVLDNPGPRTVDVEVRVSQTDGTGFLASAGTGYIDQNGYQNGDAYRRIVDNVDDFPADADINITVDFGYDYHLGTSPIPGSPVQWDFYSVMLHEVTHGLGIASLTTSSGTSQASPTALFTGWDNLLYETSTTTKVWSAAAAPSYQLDAGDLDQGDSTLEFRGTNTNTSFGSFPPIYTPASFTAGSSISHWQQIAPIPAGTVMRPQIPNNTEQRTYQPFELAALEDLGYSLTPASVNDWMMY